MNIWDVLILLAVAGALTLAFRTARRKNDSGCSCGCEGCGKSAVCSCGCEKGAGGENGEKAGKKAAAGSPRS